jgi:hypothetical protein
MGFKNETCHTWSPLWPNPLLAVVPKQFIIWINSICTNMKTRFTHITPNKFYKKNHYRQYCFFHESTPYGDLIHILKLF